MRLLCILGLLLPALAPAQKFHTYVGRLDADSVLLAWGTTQGIGNTIGLSSGSHGRATVRIADSALVESQKNWVVVNGLQPDTDYPYEVLPGERRIGGGKVRTWPQKARKLAFFVIGDYGTGASPQYEVAEAMRGFSRRGKPATTPCASSSPPATTSTPAASGSVCTPTRATGTATGKSKFFRPYE